MTPADPTRLGYRNRILTILRITLLVFIAPNANASIAPLNSNAGTHASLRTTRGTIQSETQALKPGAPLEHQLAGGETHTFRVTLTTGQYARIVVDQKGIDVLIRMFNPEGRKLTEVDNTGRLETAFVVAGSAGEFRVEVQAAEKEAKAGAYEIRLEVLRPATDKDYVAVAAERLFEDGNQSRDRRTADSRREAIKKYEEALPLWREAGDKRGEANTLNELGVSYSILGEPKKAVGIYDQAVELWRATGDHLNEAITLTNSGIAYGKLGESQKALERHSQALPLAKLAGDRQIETIILSNIGSAYWLLGQPQEALTYYNQALPYLEAGGNRRQQAVTLNNIATIYQQLGEMQEAQKYLGQSLLLRRAVGDRQGEATTLHNLGNLHQQLGERQEALKYLTQALEMSRAIGDRRLEAYELNSIGKIYLLLNDPQKALSQFNQAFSLARAVEDRWVEIYILNNIGDSYFKLGSIKRSLEYYNQALELNRSFRDQIGEASTLFHIARAQSTVGNLETARAQIEVALGIIESIRIKVGNQGLRSSYLASNQEVYSFYVDLLMQLHKSQPSARYDAAALQASERARARGLLEILIELRADIRQGVDPVLLERERSLQRQLSVKAERLTKMLGGKHTDEQENAAKTEVEALLEEYHKVEAEIRAKSPRYAALTQPQPLPVAEIQQQVLDENTLLLEYALGEKRSYLWAVTPTSVKSFELPRRAEIEVVARRAYEALTARNKVVSFEEPGERKIRIAKADNEYAQAANELSRTLLGPVANQLKGKRLLIVSDGILQYLPFAALPLPDSSRQGTKQLTYVPLIVRHEVVNLPSASTLAVLRKERSARQPAPMAVAVLADPVFDSSDERVKAVRASVGAQLPASPDQNRAQAGNQVTDKELTRAIIDVAPDGEESSFALPRLPFTRQEAEAVTAFAPARQYEKVLDFAANRTTALDPRLGQYRYIHFATHAILNTRHPELSGIVLSLVDQAGKDQDGFLLAHEIYNLNLPAELVVLSGCRTGLGKEVKGEGLLGLTRGFMYAGAARVVVSLWDVNDKSTAELMAQFYKGVLGKQRLSAATALRQAQLEIWKSTRHHAPYYWAAFVIQGEYR